LLPSSPSLPEPEAAAFRANKSKRAGFGSS